MTAFVVAEIGINDDSWVPEYGEKIAPLDWLKPTNMLFNAWAWQQRWQ